MSQQNLKAGIIGASGYTGVELMRLLAAHQQVEIHVVTSNLEKGNRVTDVFPSLTGAINMKFSAHNSPLLNNCDVVFFATPHATSMHTIPKLLDAGVKIIDLSADFRLRDPEQWHHWYGVEHAAPELLARAVYGLPELNRQQISKADLIANPGCYPTAVLLGFLPLIEKNYIATDSLIADVKSGASGAGRDANSANIFSHVSESLRAYNILNHRHLPEICQVLGDISGHTIDMTFSPHLVPMVRGILATLYASLSQSAPGDITEIYKSRYADEPFVDILTEVKQLDTGSVRGTNMCRISVHQTQHNDRLVILSVIDNLVKGAAGQAVQNMNIMFAFDEQSGLNCSALYP